ncbi:MAG: cytochrome-c peroxidase [Deltaproteobacteria bacterium]|nr:cytochrome-c peroxidase [Deltaproteobacteria bacterium]MBT8465190.1 cytochrome-c peroxidase [Deltaproteobacteria bacterium]NND27237.1 cytochrome-c peroxidase [Myxococcales bacterium]NNK41031.1 cytochrome-c peroxidase [Myxococcales bacterium]RZV53713.1 MAG: cytochrome-c peroxidase [Deltaproteobacteria bacterium]
MRRLSCLAVALVALVAACGDPAEPLNGWSGLGGSDGAPNTAAPLPWPVTEFPPLPKIAQDVPEARIRLGNLLFYDPILSVDRVTACATCHSEFWGMSDALPVAVGHGAGPLAGPGREGPNTLRRNSPALFNLAFRESLFWDGRSESLEAQAITPLLAEDELNLDPEIAIAELMAIPEYVELFAAAFPENPEVTVQNLASALAAFQRTMVSSRSLYDAYAGGQAATLSEELVEGMFLFAEMGCDDCHSPPLFESETFANRNVPASDGIIDEGRAEVTGLSEDIGRFRAPTLRNLFESEPYFHNGSVKRLEDAVRHELEQTGISFGEEDVRLIELFVRKGLRDDSRSADRPKTVPSGLPTPLDGPIFPGR